MATILPKFQPDLTLLHRLEAPESEPLNVQLKSCPALREFLAKVLPYLDKYQERTRDVTRYLKGEVDYLPAGLVAPEPPIPDTVRMSLKELLSRRRDSSHLEEEDQIVLARLAAIKQHLDDMEEDRPLHILEPRRFDSRIEREKRFSSVADEGYFRQLERWQHEAPGWELAARREAVARIRQFDAREGVLLLDGVGLTSVPPLPEGVKWLDLSRNPLNSLEGMPKEIRTLETLDLSETPLTTLAYLPRLPALEHLRLSKATRVLEGFVPNRIAENPRVAISYVGAEKLREFVEKKEKEFKPRREYVEPEPRKGSLMGRLGEYEKKEKAIKPRREYVELDPRKGSLMGRLGEYEKKEKEFRPRKEVIQAQQEKIKPMTQAYLDELNAWCSEAPKGEELARKEAFARIQKFLDVKSGELSLTKLGLTSVPPLPPGIKRLDLSHNPLVSLRGMPKEMNALEELNLEWSRSLRSLEGLPKEMPALKKLDLSWTPIRDLKGLPKEMPALKTLNLHKTNITTLQGLPEKMNTVEKLVLSPYLVSLKGLPREMPALKKLDLSNTNITTLQGLPEKMNALEELTLDSCLSTEQLASLKGLPKEMPALKSLSLLMAKGITTLEGLPEKLNALEKLVLAQSGLVSLKGLPKEMPALKELDLSWTKITTLQGLPREMPALKKLNLEGTAITTLQGLPKEMSALEELDLGITQITTLQGLPKEMPALKKLDLGGLDITTLQGLPKEMPALKKLSLIGTGITTLDYIPHSVLNNPNAEIDVRGDAQCLSKKTRDAIDNKTYAARFEQ